MFIYEINPVWDEEKERIIGSEHNSFNISVEIGNSLPYKWWRLEDESNKIIGYGWLIYENDSVEVSLSIEEEHRGKGISKLILSFLEEQILNDNLSRNIVATINSTNTNGDKVIKLLKKCGYKPYAFLIDDAVKLLTRGIDISFYKTL